MSCYKSCCTCPLDGTRTRASWVVTQYKHNRSAFNGYKATASAYSTISCTECGSSWRTKAAYVDTLFRGLEPAV